jgi:F plasmid transfer operon protein TraF
MIKRSLLTAGLIAASISTVHALPYGFYDARSVAMGNASVATGGVTTAALSNPGMLMVNEYKDSFALLLPAIGVQVIDDGNVIDLVDEFQALDPLNPVDQARGIQIVTELEGKSIVAAVIPNIAFVSSGESFTWGITLRGDAVVSSGLKGPDDPAYDPLNPQVDALGVAITEVGVPMGTAFSVAGMQLSVGITPRYLQIDAIEYTSPLSTADIEDVKNAESQSLGNLSTVDAGVVLSLVDTFRVGFVAKNLIEDSKTTNIGRVIEVETQYRVGASFDGGFFTLAADMDLNERKPIAFENVYQSLSVGAEFDAFETVQLRVGYQSNLASGATDPDLLSAGVGIWLGFNLDLAVVVGDDSSYGAFAQTGFHF